jgi:hypothetical protein
LRRSLLAVALLACAVLVACGGGSSKSVVGTPDAGSAATATPDQDAEKTALASSVATQIQAALLQSADLPAALPRLASGVQFVPADQFPGQAVRASVAAARFGRDKQTEFVNVALIVPDSGGPLPLMQNFNPQAYLQGLTASAPDPTSAPITVTGGPPGAQSFRYGGTVSAGGGTQTISGEVLAFVHGKVFVLLVHGTTADATPGIDLAALAATVDARLASLPEAN